MLARYFLAARCTIRGLWEKRNLDSNTLPVDARGSVFAHGSNSSGSTDCRA